MKRWLRVDTTFWQAHWLAWTWLLARPLEGRVENPWRCMLASAGALGLVLAHCYVAERLRGGKP